MVDGEKKAAKPKPSTTPNQLHEERKAEFARRLYRLLTAKGMTQAELGRRVGDKNRSNISSYLKRRSIPEPPRMHRLASALGVDVNDLLPDYNELELPVEKEALPSFRWRIGERNDQVGFIELNRWVSVSTSLKIQELLSQDKTKGDE